MAGTRKDDFARFTTAGTTKIIIGTPPSTSTYHIYTDLLCNVSPYFRTKIDQLRSPLFIRDRANAGNARPSPSTSNVRPSTSNRNRPQQPTAGSSPLKRSTVYSNTERNGSPIIDLEAEPLVLNEPNLALEPFKPFINWLYNRPFPLDLVPQHDLVVDIYLLAHTLGVEQMRNDLVDAVRRYHACNEEAIIGIKAMRRLADTRNPDGEGVAGEWGGRTANGNMDKNDNRQSGPVSAAAARGTRQEQGQCQAKENPPRNPENKLLEFLTAILTYKIVARGWEVYKHNEIFKRILGRSKTVTMWHLDNLHEMFAPSTSALTTSFAKRKAHVKGEVSDDEGDIYFNGNNLGRNGCGRPAKRQKTATKGSAGRGWTREVNPAKRTGCQFHEHKESKCRSPISVDD